MSKKIIAFLISFVFLFEQIGFAQVANVIDLSGSFSSVSSINKFRPLHLRSLAYDRIKDNFTLLLDKGDNKNLKSAQLKDSIAKLMEYFQIGVALPDNAFWVNLRPDGKDDIIDPAVEKTDLGKVLLEADLQLKKDMAMATSPKTREGKIYWKRLYEKAESLLGGGQINIPTMTRPWIVPGEIIVKQSADSAYVYKATLKVMLEQDYLKNSATYGFDDPRLKELNEYSSGLIRELLIPKLTKKVNSAKEYAPLRQVYYSLVLAQWFKKNSGNIPVEYSRRINTKELSGLISKTAWSKETYFKAYHRSFASGEYNTQETVSGLNGMTVRRYFSGGITLMPAAGTDVAVITQKTPIVPADVLAVEDKNYRPVNNDQQARDGGEAESEGRGDLKDNVEVGFGSSSRKISAGDAAVGPVNKVPVSRLQGISAAAFLGFLGGGTMLMLAAKFIGLAEFGWIIGPIALVCALISGIVYERARDRDQKAFSSVQPAAKDGGASLSGMSDSKARGRIGGVIYLTAGGLFFATALISANPLFYFAAGVSFLASSLSFFWASEAGGSDNYNRDGGSDIRADKITKDQRSRVARAISSLINATDVVAVTSFFAVVVAPLLSISGYAVVLALSLVWKDIGVMFFQLPPVISVPSSIFIGAATILGLDKASYTAAYLIDTRIDDFEGPAAKRQQDGGFFAPARSRTDELSSAIEEIGWMRSADRDFVDRRLDRIKSLIQDNKYTPDEINTVISSIDTKALDEWLFTRKTNTALMLGGFVVVGGLTLAAFLISGPVFLPMALGVTAAALSGIAGGYSLHKLISRDIPVRDLTSEYYNEAAKMLNAAVLVKKNNSGALNPDGGNAAAGVLAESWLDAIWYFHRSDSDKENAGRRLADSASQIRLTREFLAAEDKTLDLIQPERLYISAAKADVNGNPLVISGGDIIQKYTEPEELAEKVRWVAGLELRDPIEVLQARGEIEKTSVSDTEFSLDKKDGGFFSAGMSGINSFQADRLAFGMIFSGAGLMFVTLAQMFANQYFYLSAGLMFMGGSISFYRAYRNRSNGGKTDLTLGQVKLENMFQDLRVSLRQVKYYPGGVAADEGYGGGELNTKSLEACVKKVITSRAEFERMMEYINGQVTIANSKWYSFIPTPRAAALVNAYNKLGLLGSSNTLKFDKDSAGPVRNGYVRLNNGFTAPADLTQKVWEGLKTFRGNNIFAAFDLAMAARFPGVFVLSKKEKADAISAGLLKADGSFDKDARNIIISSCDGAGVMEFAARNPVLNTAVRDGGEAYGYEVNKLLDQLTANDFTGQLEGAANGASYEAVKKIGNGKLSELGFEPLKGEWVNRLGWTITNLKAIRDGSAGRTLEDVINDGKELKEKYKYVIFCGMGGSGLSVQFVKDTFKNEAAENIYSLRTTDPTVITLMLKEIAEKEGGLKAALDKTAIVLISKSATTPETVAHRKYFEGVYNTLGLDTQKNLWFITDTISPWGVEAQGNPAMRQREIQLNGRGDVGGRFTAPGTNVFLLPMAVVAPDSIIPIIDNAIAMNSVKDDPFLRLGAFMTHMAKDLHKDKLTIIVPPALRSYPMWAEQLIEESLGKFGKGITLFYDEGDLDVSALKPVDSNDRVFLRINLGMMKPQADLWKYLNDNGYPTYEIALNDLEDIGGLMLGMQRAVAVFGYLWDICFVNQPAVEGYKIASKLMDTEIINAGGDVKKVLNNIYPAASKKGALTLYYDPLIQMGAVNIGDIQAHVSSLGSTMDDPAAVYAALIFLLKDKIEAGEFTSYGNMTDNLKAIFEKARAEVFTRGLKMPAKLGVGPDKNHAYQQNIEDGKNMFFSTYFLPLQAIQPKEFDLLKSINGFSDSMIKAQTLGTVQSMIKNSRKVVLITSDLTAQGSETEMAEFFAAVVGYLARNEASGAEKNTSDGGDVGGEVKDIGYLHNNLKDSNSAARGSAARDLAARKDKRSIAPLIEALKTETMPSNRYAIARALAAIGPEALGPLMLVATGQNIKSQIREEAAAAINSIKKGMNDGGAAEIRELYAKAAVYSPQIKPLLDILTDDTVSFEAQLEAARLLIAQPAGKKFILENKEILSREIGIMMVLLDNPRFDGGTGIYSTNGIKANLKNIDLYDYKKARGLALVLAKRILRGELSAYFAGRLTVVGDVSVGGPVTIGYKETPTDTVTVLYVSSAESKDEIIRSRSISPIQIMINEVTNDIVLSGADKQVVVPSVFPGSDADGGKMPTDARFNAWDIEGKVKREDNDRYSSAAKEAGGSTSGEVNTGDNVFDGGDKTADPVGGIDFRGMPVISQPAIGAARIPVLPKLIGAVALEELNKQWMEIRTSMVQGPVPYLRIQEYIACCNARPDSSKQIQAVTNCVADILKAEEEDALPTCGQLKEILIQLG